MKTDLEQARSILEQEGQTWVLCRLGQVYQSSRPGVTALLDWLDSGEELRYFAAAGQQVGKAEAMLCCLLGVREVSAAVMTKAAVRLLVTHRIPVLWGRQVEALDDPSPAELAVAELEDPASGLAAIRASL